MYHPIRIIVIFILLVCVAFTRVCNKTSERHPSDPHDRARSHLAVTRGTLIPEAVAKKTTARDCNSSDRVPLSLYIRRPFSQVNLHPTAMSWATSCRSVVLERFEALAMSPHIRLLDIDFVGFVPFPLLLCTARHTAVMLQTSSKLRLQFCLI